MEKLRHTPTPWYQHGDLIGSKGYRFICQGIKGETSNVSELRHGQPEWEQAMADLDFIVCAANSHDALVMALENRLGDLAAPREGSPLFDYIQQAQAALKAAKGE